MPPSSGSRYRSKRWFAISALPSFDQPATPYVGRSYGWSSVASMKSILSLSPRILCLPFSVLYATIFLYFSYAKYFPSGDAPIVRVTPFSISERSPVVVLTR